VDHSSTRHEVDNYRSLLEPLRIAASHRPQILIDGQAQRKIDRLFHRPYIILHPWAGGQNGWRKEWPLDSWSFLINSLEHYGHKVVITGARADTPRADILLKAADKSSDYLLSVAGQLSLMETAALLSNARLIITVNTGIMHIAAAVNSNVIALHGPTNPRRWGPLNEDAISLVPPGEGHGYTNLGFEYPRNAVDSMLLLSADQVIAVARRKMTEWLTHQPPHLDLPLAYPR
jgi:ADP-heptose:LPS heptosyltransferase